MKKPLNYLREAGRNFIGSFRTLDRGIFLIVVYRMVFYISVIVAFTKYQSVMIKSIEPISAFGVSDFANLSESTMISVSSALKSVYFSLFLYAALFGIAILLVYSITNFLIWAAITSTKINKSRIRFMLRFIGLNYIWAIAWAVLFVLIAVSIRREVVGYWGIALILLYSHFTALLCISYFMKKRIGKSIKSAFSTGFGKIQHFVVPYVLAAAVFMVINLVFMPLQRHYATYLNIVNIILFLFYFAWLRIYIYSFAKKLV